MPRPPDLEEGMLDESVGMIDLRAWGVIRKERFRYVLPMSAVTGEVQLARQAGGEICAVVAVGLVISLNLFS